MKYKKEPKTDYEKQEALRRSRFISHINNTNYTVSLNDKDLYVKIDDCIFNSELKCCFVFIGKNTKANDEKLFYVLRAMKFCDIKIKCWSITNNTNFVFLKRQPLEIYEELLSLEYLNKSEYDYLVKEIDNEIAGL